MSWQNDPIVSAAAPTPWANDPIVQVERRKAPRTAVGVLDALQAGYQGGGTGLAIRGQLPDVVLDPSHAKWYEKLAAGVAQIGTEIPQTIVGAVAGGAAGTTAGPVGTILGTGAGSMAVPAAIRSSLIEAYKSGTAQSSGGFLNSAKIVIKDTLKEGLIGGATFGVGAKVARTVGSAIAPSIGQTMSVGTATKAIGAAQTTAEIGTMVVAGSALEGKLPEWEDFLNAAVMVGGIKASVGVAQRIGKIYAETGKTPAEVVADVKANPALGAELTKPEVRDPVTRAAAPEEIPAQYKPLAAEENARNAITDPAAAKAFVEKPFGEVPQAPGAPKVQLHVNYDYITSPDDAKAALARASELYGPKILEQTRGKVSWEQTEKQAKQDLADMIGQADFSLLDARTPGTAANATELLLRKQLMEGAVEDFTRRARAYDAAKSSPEEAVQMLAAGERVAMLSAQFQGAASEAGRALNILKNARDSARSAEEVQKLLDLYGTDPATLAKIMQGVDNPVAAAKAARELVKATRWDKFVEAYKAILISGPISQVANVVGNATFLPLRPVIDATAATLGAIRGSPDRVRAIEPVVRITGYWQGMVDALRSGNEWIKLYGDKPFMEGLRDLDANLGARKAEVKKRAIEGDLGVLARSPFLTLSIPDQLFRLMHERGEANTLAARRAIKEGYTVGSQEFAERMAHHLNNPDTAMMQEIRAMGDRGTFNADMGKIGTAAQTLIRESKTEWLFPFVRTPANVVKELIRMTPGAPIIDTWRADIAKGGASAEKAVAEAMVGSLMMSFFVGMAQGGKITGAGEPDPGKKRVDLAAGKQPYSFMGSDGKMYDFQRLQPVGTLVGIAADMSEVWDRMTPEERDKVPKMVSVAFANAVTNQTMLMGVTNLVKAMSDPDQFGARFVQNTAAGLVPGAVGQTAQLNDPYMREIYSVLDAVKNRVPGTREDLQPKIDVWGRPVENRDRVGGIGPSRIMEVSKDPVVSEASRLGVSVPAAPKDIILPAGGDRKLGKVELTPEQRTTFSTVAGQVAYNVLTPIVNSPGWASTPDMIKKRTYEVAFERARAAARAAALPIEQREIESGRIMDVINQRLGP